eukprot:m.94391 g.94391  ORF g.94391 m.94391 type:complete len:61 (+) comp16542_c0_seq1:73-255(+)
MFAAFNQWLQCYGSSTSATMHCVVYNETPILSVCVTDAELTWTTSRKIATTVVGKACKQF